jgi:ribosomal protein S18 acetylase RimI-like enzyme
VSTPGAAEAGGRTLREATDADVPAIVAVSLAAFAEHRGVLGPPSGAHAETPEVVRAKMKTARVVLACVDGQLVASVFYEPAEGHLHLFRLAVLPAYRQRGIARSLIDYVEGRACQLGLARVRLGVRIALGRQRAYYERLGYRQVAACSHPGHAEPTYLLLDKELPAGTSGPS